MQKITILIIKSINTYYKILLFICFFSLYQRLQAQKVYVLEEGKITQTISTKGKQQTSQIIDNLIKKAQKKAYLSASVDSVFYKENDTYLLFSLGKPYFLKQITAIELPEKRLKKFSVHYKKNKKYSLATVEKHKQKLLDNYTHYGYLQAKLNTNTIFIDTNKIKHIFFLDKGKLFFYRSIENAELKKSEIKFLSQLIGVRKGKPSNKKDIDNFEKKINQTFFYKVDSLKIKEDGGKLIVFPYLSDVSKNKIAAWLGFQTDNEQKSSFVGNVNFSTQNLLKTGESIDFQWDKSKPQSQDLQIKSKFPFLFGLPVGVQADFSLNKQDSSFFNRNYRLGLLTYPFMGADFSAYYNQKHTETYLNEQKGNRTKQNLYGLHFTYQNIDDLYFPNSGMKINCDINTGTQFSDSAKNMIINLSFDFSAYLKTPLGNLKIQNLFGKIYSPHLSQAELYQMGGLNNMRGFNERSVFCKTFNISTLEYRFLFNRSSYFKVFYDLGFFDMPLRQGEKYLQAVGGGLVLNTKGGILSLIYAVGKENPQRFDLKTAKVHIGYSIVF